MVFIREATFVKRRENLWKIGKSLQIWEATYQQLEHMQSPRKGRIQVSEGGSAACWHAKTVAYAPWKPL